MPISDKTRKILWGRSGNRCAICRHELVIDATDADDESVVGDECHIISGQSQGPRYDPEFHPERLNDPENLILLCRIHHKMVDDQRETYSAEILSKLKNNHEKWVASALSGEAQIPPVRIRRIKGNTLPFLVRLTSGQEIMTVVGGAYQFAFEHAEPESEEQVELLGEFLQELKDWGELWDEIDPAERVKAMFGLSERVRKLENVGFWVFGAREVRRIEGGVGTPSPWPIAMIKVVRRNDAEITRLNPETNQATTS